MCPPTNLAARAHCPIGAALASTIFTRRKQYEEPDAEPSPALVKLTVYRSDLAHLAAFHRVKDRYVNAKEPPASTLGAGQRLDRPRTSGGGRCRRRLLPRVRRPRRPGGKTPNLTYRVDVPLPGWLPLRSLVSAD